MRLKNFFIATSMLFGTVFMLYGNTQLISQSVYKQSIVLEQVKSGTLGKE